MIVQRPRQRPGSVQDRLRRRAYVADMAPTRRTGGYAAASVVAVVVAALAGVFIAAGPSAATRAVARPAVAAAHLVHDAGHGGHRAVVSRVVHGATTPWGSATFAAFALAVCVAVAAVSRRRSLRGSLRPALVRVRAPPVGMAPRRL